MTSEPSATTLQSRTHAFCQALISPPPPTDLLRTHFTSTPRITEHGPAWSRTRLPFLAHPFTGLSECESYFSLLSDTLTMQLPADAFPGPEGFAVSSDEGVEKSVWVQGKGRFASRKTGKAWDEVFAYRFSKFDKQGRIGMWEIWADPLSAWVACGEGGEERKEGVNEEERNEE